ncbi:MAG: Hsp20/alpha crystallin family protein [Anaerolineales bacterium]|jgi:HSP20 family protein|nr:Hsp20/alpha crystallin family protein [Anaerolineales bacterium]
MGKEYDSKHRVVMMSGENDAWDQQALEGLGWRVVRRSHAWRPPTDVLETDDVVVVVVEIAGMRGLNISVIFEHQVLSIRGVRTDTNICKTYHQMEIDYGEFASEVQVPFRVDSDKIEATYSDGFLKVVLPKATPREIDIK